MALSYQKSATIALSALSLCLGVTGSAQAGFLPGVQNLDFTQYTGSAPKDYFTNVNPVGWVGGGGLIFIATNQVGHRATDGYLDTYGNPSALPGNYVMADGNPDYEGSFSQMITGLNPGETYTLSFYQGASQQAGFANGLATTMQWIVSLGDDPLSLCNNCGPVDPVYGQTSTYYNTDPLASISPSQEMITPAGGTTDWQYVSVSLTAHSTSALLSFLAWGDRGSTINLPPIAFLSNTNSPPNLVPEPASLTVLGFGLLGLAVGVRRRAKRSNQV